MSHVLRLAFFASMAAGALPAQFHLPGLGGSSTPKTSPAPSAAKVPETSKSVAEPAPTAAPTAIDYYVLSIAWPSGKPVVTGFAPRAIQGTAPESCSSAKPASKGAMSIVGSLMTDQATIQHEWMKHGSCTGFTAAEYFNAMRYVRSLVQIPVQLTSPDEDAPRETPQLIEAQFASANVAFPAGAFQAAEVRTDICFDAQFRAKACPATGSK